MQINMFKKLKKDFVILNMSSIALLMLTVLATVYLFVYQNTISDLRRRVGLVAGNTNPVQNISPNDGFEYDTLIPSDYALSFNIKIDENENIEKIYTYIDMPFESYKKAKDSALKNNKRYGAVKLQKRTWYYEVVDKEALVLTPNGFQTTSIHDSISFIDMSDAKQTLNSILLSFGVVGTLMMGAIYLISVQFAKRAVVGIEGSWYKQKQFVADASHELKTPLAIIKTNLAALKSDVGSNQWLDNIDQEATRMDSLIKDLLLLAQAEELDMTLQKRDFNLSSMLESNLLIFEPKIFEANLKMTSNIAEDITLYNDSVKVDQVIKILIDNAIKYSLDQGLIQIKLEKNNKETVLTIENESETLSESDLNHVFDRFYRRDKARTGTNASFGLGLPIAKMMVEKMGGKITMTSSNNNTKVKIIF